MSQMHQINLSYLATEDRLLLRINTKQRQEFRFWMTRRYTGLVWQALNQIFAAKLPGEAPAAKVDPLVEATKQEIKHQQVVSQADFKTEYQASDYLPLGESPILLFSVGIRPAPDGQPLLCMHPEKGSGIEMIVNEPIAHSLCQLILETVGKADWRLPLVFSSGPRREVDPDVDERPGLN